MEYEIVKPMSIKALIQAQGDVKCDGFWKGLEEFIDYTIESDKYKVRLELWYSDDLILSYAKDHPRAAEFLKDKGFIKVKEPELKACPNCKSKNPLTFSNADGDDNWFIECSACGMRGPRMATCRVATDLWNMLPRV